MVALYASMHSRYNARYVIDYSIKSDATASILRSTQLPNSLG